MMDKGINDLLEKALLLSTDRFPIADAAGGPAQFVSLAALLDFYRTAQLAEAAYVYPEEFDKLAGSGPLHDDTPAIQAMFLSAILTGRRPALRNVRYYPYTMITVDPARCGLEGNGGILDGSRRNYVDPASMPELLGDPSFLTGAGWIASANETLAPTFDGDLRFTPRDSVQDYLERGRKIIAPAGAVVRVYLTINELTSHTVGSVTFHDVGVSFRRDTGTAAGSIGAGPNVGGQNWFVGNTSGYTAGMTVWRDFVLTEADPYIRIQSNAQVRLGAISAKVVPNNTILLLQVPPASQGGQLRGHNYRDWTNFKIAGRSDQAAYVIAVTWDTPVYPTNDLGQHSRANWYNVDISDGVGVVHDFRNRTYLSSFIGCRFTAAKACVTTMPGAADAGEKITFTACGFGAGEIGVSNEGGYEIHLLSCSIDFSRQWYVGGPGFRMVAGHLETNQAVVAGYPWIHVKGGYCRIDAKLQVNGSTTPVLENCLYVEKGGFLDIESDTPYNLHSTSGAITGGAGRVRFAGRGGASKEIDPILKRDVDHNLFGVGGQFEDSEVFVSAWTSSSVADQQIDRHTVGWTTTKVTVAATNSRGSYACTVTSSSGISLGMMVTGPGVQPLTFVTNIQSTTISLSKRIKVANAGVNFTFHGSAQYGVAGLELSTARARTGAQSLRLFKTGVGSGNLIVYLAVPVERCRAIGAELFWTIPAGVGSGTTSVYFQGLFARLIEDNGRLVPSIAPGAQTITDQPQTAISLVDGVPWTRMSFGSNRVDASSAHDGYAPEWATHCVIVINLSSVPAGFEMSIDDLHANHL